MLRNHDVRTLDFIAYALICVTGILVVLSTGSFVLGMAAMTALGAIQAGRDVPPK